ncbi:hypothetical protein M885DRAFT_506817 [Pelagophyceae sp. CCMP2097]|nr:hypothetical protein M885DRAFT_506817 [Pelagophyceae sp. CCMP2097]|mmetsp:Transcript_32070/g.112753  ORF Transcript_32070/g.112753 Transcript_32070/m.112753 type:complete len:413 (-) Transcript_32070:79-1317(-)
MVRAAGVFRRLLALLACGAWAWSPGSELYHKASLPFVVVQRTPKGVTVWIHNMPPALWRDAQVCTRAWTAGGVPTEACFDDANGVRTRLFYPDAAFRYNAFLELDVANAELIGASACLVLKPGAGAAVGFDASGTASETGFGPEGCISYDAISAVAEGSDPGDPFAAPRRFAAGDGAPWWLADAVDEALRSGAAVARGDAFSAAPPEAFAGPGLVSLATRQFLHVLVRCVAFHKSGEAARYVEVGTFKGASLCAAASARTPGSPVVATGIDDWSFTATFNSSRSVAEANLAKCGAADVARLITGDAYAVAAETRAGAGIPVDALPIDIYMYDGDHSSADQFRGIVEFQKFFADDVVIIVDDFQGESVRRATRTALDVLARDYGWTLIAENAAHKTTLEREANGIFVLSRKST